MTKADLKHHGLSVGMPVIVTPGIGPDKRRAKETNPTIGTIYAISESMFTLITSAGYKSFLLTDLQLKGPDRVTVEVLKC